MKKLLSMSIVLALVLSFSLAATTPVAAATHNVSHGESIQDAIDDAQDGDVIFVEAGYEVTLDERIWVEKPITLTTDEGDPARLIYQEADTGSVVDIRSEAVVLENFIIERNQGVSGSQAINVRRSNVVIQGTTITGSDNTHGPSVIPGIHLTTGDPGSYDIPLEGVVLRDNHISGDFCYGVAVTTYTDASIEASIEGNTFMDLAWDWYDDGDYRLGWGVMIADTEHVYFGGSIDVTITGNTFDDVHGIYVIPEDEDTGVFDVSVHCNDFLGTGNWGVWNGTDFVVDAIRNWWGDASGPTHASNPDGTGNAVSDNVDFDPWLLAAQEESLSLDTTTATGEASFTPSDGAIGSLEALPEIPPGAPSGVTFPHGMFEFVICCLTLGQTVEVTVTLPEDVPVGYVWWKYQDGEWYSLPNETDDGDNIMTIRLTDGGLGDADGVADGFISDPGGPGNPEPEPEPPVVVGWEGSLVNRLAVMAPWIALFAAIIAGATLLVVRRRRAQI